MKALAIIFTVIFVAAGVLFGLSVAATGINSGSMFGFRFNGTEETGETRKSEYTFSAETEYTDISILVASADARISISNDGVTRIYYTSDSNNYITAEIAAGGKLIIKENVKSVFWFFNWNFDNNSRLDIELPEREFNRIEYSTMSGSGDAELPSAEKLNVSTASGNVRIFTFAEKLDISSMSGSTEIINKTNEKCRDISLSNASGKTLISGFEADTFKVSCMSGNVGIRDISGRGTVSVASGDVELWYKEWDDSLNLSIMSGKAGIYVPKNSGIDFTLSILSGYINYDLDGGTQTIGRNQKSASVGGENIQKVSVSLSSGKAIFETIGVNDNTPPATTSIVAHAYTTVTEILPSEPVTEKNHH